MYPTNDGLYLTDDRYFVALKRLRARIAGGLALTFHDDDTVGSKSTECSWGLCSHEKEAWPDAEDQLFEDDFRKHGRIAPKYQRQGQTCPFDANPSRLGSPNGCFYDCMVFQRSKPTPTREQALALYDERIRR